MLLCKAYAEHVVKTYTIYLMAVNIRSQMTSSTPTNPVKATPIFVPMLLVIIVVVTFYPGFMSYDTIHALVSARNGVLDSMWPPMVSYVWALVDFVWPHPWVMFLVQVMTLMLSINFIVYRCTGSYLYTALALVAYLAVPVILGTVVVIWKDVLMAAIFLAALAFMLPEEPPHMNLRKIARSSVALLLIFIGLCVRHNGVFAAVPLVYLFSLNVLRQGAPVRKRIPIRELILTLGIVILLFTGKTVIDMYSLPSLNKLSSSTEFFIRSVRILDIAGASVCANQNLFDELAPTLSVAQIADGYDARHINLSSKVLTAVPENANVNSVWLRVAAHHPICFMSNKASMTAYLLGVEPGDQFAITSPGIDTNPYGYKLAESHDRDVVVEYIVSMSKVDFLRPWFLYVVTSFLLLMSTYLKRVTTEVCVISASGFFYFASLVLFGNAADARLPFYSTTAVLLTFALLLYENLREIK